MQVGSDIDELISNSKKSKKKVLEKPTENLSEAKKIALLKDKKWAYENEFRMVFDASDTGLINEDGQWYLSVKITNIYLGVSFDENENIHRNDLIKLCKDKKIKIAEMKKSLVNYSVVIRRKGVEKNVLVQV